MEFFFIMLVETVFRTPIPEHLTAQCSVNPETPEDSYRNFHFALVHLDQINKTMPLIKIEEIIKGDLPAILDLLWALVFRAEIEPITINGETGIAALQIWTSQMIANYSLEFYDFKKSFESGYIFACILYQASPQLVDLNALTTLSNLERLHTVFALANQYWSIPFLIDPDDGAEDPDDVCVMVYLAFCHNFVR